MATTEQHSREALPASSVAEPTLNLQTTTKKLSNLHSHVYIGLFKDYIFPQLTIVSMQMSNVDDFTQNGAFLLIKNL